MRLCQSHSCSSELDYPNSVYNGQQCIISKLCFFLMFKFVKIWFLDVWQTVGQGRNVLQRRLVNAAVHYVPARCAFSRPPWWCEF